MKHILFAVFAVTLAGPAAAQMKGMEMKGMHDDMHMKSDRKAGAPAAHKASGTVKSVDAAKGSASIAHGAIQSLEWPAMTMTFKLKDKAMAGSLKPGEKIDFNFVQSGKDYVITEIHK